MATTTPPAISGLPAAPDPNDRSTFNTRAYPWSAALPTLSTEIAAVAANVKANADDCKTNADIAVAQAVGASTSASLAQAAATSAGSIAWVSGTTYAIGDLRYSPVDFQTYRKKTSSLGGTTDPSLDATNWALAVRGGLTLLATLTPTVAANVDFLTVFSGAYDNYLIQYEGVKPQTANALSMQFAIAGAASSANTYYNLNVNTSTSTPSIYCRITSGSVVHATLGGASGVIHIKNVNSAGADKSALSHGAFTENATQFIATASSHLFATSGVLTGVRFLWESGSNFQAVGKIRVYGYANT